MKISMLLLLGAFCSYGQTYQDDRHPPPYAAAHSSGKIRYVVGKIYVLPTTETEKPDPEKEIRSNGITLFPNPVTNVLNVVTADKSLLKTIDVIGMDGRIVYSSKLSNNSADLSFLKQGAYTVKFDKDNSKTFKIIKN